MEENGEWGGGLMTENNKFWAPQILLIILCSLGSPVSARPVEPQKHPPPFCLNSNLLKVCISFFSVDIPYGVFF